MIYNALYVLLGWISSRLYERLYLDVDFDEEDF